VEPESVLGSGDDPEQGRVLSQAFSEKLEAAAAGAGPTIDPRAGRPGVVLAAEQAAVAAPPPARPKGPPAASSQLEVVDLLIPDPGAQIPAPYSFTPPTGIDAEMSFAVSHAVKNELDKLLNDWISSDIRLLQLVRRALSINFGGVSYPLTPQELEEVAHRAKTNGLTLEKEIERMLDYVRPLMLNAAAH
jgi:hypothetical protein